MIKDVHWMSLHKFPDNNPHLYPDRYPEFQESEFPVLVLPEKTVPKKFRHKRNPNIKGIKVRKALRTNSPGDLKDAYLRSSVGMRKTISDPNDTPNVLDTIPFTNDLQLDATSDFIIS